MTKQLFYPTMGFGGERGGGGKLHSSNNCNIQYRVPQAGDPLLQQPENKCPVFIQDEGEAHAGHLDVERGFQDVTAFLIHFQSILFLITHVLPLLEVLVPSNLSTVSYLLFSSPVPSAKAQDSTFSGLLRSAVTQAFNFPDSKIQLL